MNTFKRNAFTLVELLTVVVIITILASLSLVALSGSMQTAKEIKTYGTIQKLDTAVLPLFESYEQRFETILDELDTSTGFSNDTSRLNDANLVRLKLHLIHDVMRMEMPSYWPEIASISGSGLPTKQGPIGITLPVRSGGSLTYRVKEPTPLKLYFNSLYKARQRNSGCDLDQGAAELLFLIIANRNPEALEGFGGTEIADTDGNGLLEFVDAWGRPIYFLRAAPGFTGTDRQPDVVQMANLPLGNGTTANADRWSPTPTEVNWDTASGSLVNAYREAVTKWADPFDSGGVVGRSWFLYPVIVSAGPDGVFDLAFGRQITDANGKPVLAAPGEQTRGNFNDNLRVSDINPFNFATGIPEDKDDDPGTLNHYDNIHNHRHRGGF